MHIVVSFCNQKAPGLPGLGLLDVVTSDFRVLALPAELAWRNGITGLAICPRYLYVVAQSSEGLRLGSASGSSVLLLLDRCDLTLRGYHHFQVGSDVHSLWMGDGVLYAVSTGTDEVLELRLRGAEVVSEVGFWRPETQGPREDVHHLNAIVGWRGSLIVSGFGKKAGGLWNSARNGFITDIARGQTLAEGIDQPHSLADLDGALVYCESRKMTVRVVGDQRSQQLSGYTRGLCAVGASLFAATSMGRQLSKSTGAMNNPAAGDVLGGQCGITRLSAATFEVEQTIDLGAHAQEIYDLLPVEGAQDWPVEPEISWRDASIRELALMVDRRTEWAKQTAEALAQKEVTLNDLQTRVQGQEGLRRELEGLQAAVDDLRSFASLALQQWAPEAIRKQFEYQQQVRRIRGVVQGVLPADATLLVVSKGDEELLKLDGRRAWHFPRTLEGVYAGAAPANSAAAIAHLEALRVRGADFLLLPCTALWWLDHYAAFRDHLCGRYQKVRHQDDACVIYDLREPRASQAPAGPPGLKGVIAECHKRLGSEPAILDWDTGLHLATSFPHLAVFSPPPAEEVLPYLEGSIDIVAVAAAPARIAEARRVARGAVVTVAASDGEGRDTPVLGIEWRGEGATHRSPAVSVIFWTSTEMDQTRRRLDALRCSLPGDFRGEVLVLANGLAGAAVEELRRRWGDVAAPLKVLPVAGLAGYAASCNQAAAEAAGDVLVFLGNAQVPLDGWLPPLLDVLDSRPAAGAVGGKVIAADGTLDQAGGVVFADGSAAGFGGGDYQVDDPLYGYVREVDYSSDSLLVTREPLFRELGGFDPSYHDPTYANADYCFRAREQGHRVYYQPESVSASLPTGESHGPPREGKSDRSLFGERWQQALTGQPPLRHWRDRELWHALPERQATGAEERR